jgi:hypothetical protein
MTRSTQTYLILAALAIMFVTGVSIYISSENRSAIATMNYDRCWGEACKRAISYRWR